MNFDESFPKRVALARNAIGITQAELARHVGVVPRQIAAYEGGEAKPRERALQNLAAALGTTVSWLVQGAGTGPDVSNIKRTVTLREIPLLSHAQVMEKDIRGILSSSSVRDFIPAPPEAGELSFALQVLGHSMDAKFGTSFPNGIIIVVDPERPIASGDFALFLDTDGGNTLFKQFIIHQSNPYLRSLNQAYPAIPASNKYRLIGKVISAYHDFVNKYPSETKRGDILDHGAGNESQCDSQVNVENNYIVHKINEIEKKIDTILDALDDLKKMAHYNSNH